MPISISGEKKAVESDEKWFRVKFWHQIHTMLSSVLTGNVIVGSTSMLKIVLLRLGARGKPFLRFLFNACTVIHLRHPQSRSQDQIRDVRDLTMEIETPVWNIFQGRRLGHQRITKLMRS